ncbi:hypothetical protein [Mycobacterium sp. SMC-4]|uniref:hypothetical protein n=1 Tax=Mycobacterium sp. SMC-4 TaxID=2857059 RepID=UPI003D037477
MIATLTYDPHGLPLLDGIPLSPVFGGTVPGGQYGIVPAADALVSRTSDGYDINDIWDDFRDAVALLNTERNQVADLLSFRTLNAADVVAQNITPPNFELATEFGVPLSAGSPAEALPLGYTYKHHSLRSSLTWQALRVMDRRQVEGILNSILEADNKNLNGQILHRLFDPTVGKNEIGTNCFGLWSNDGIASPPPFMGTHFPANTSHYIATQNATLDSQDLEDAYHMIRSKGYAIDGRSQIIVLCNHAEAEKIATWRAGEESRTDGPIAKYDFIASKKAPPFWTGESVVGNVAPDEYHGHDVLGTYGYGWIMETPTIPQGYLAVVATGGPNSERNVVGLREAAGYEGLLTMPGNWREFPLVESFFVHSFGTGVRQRGGAVCLQVTASSTYTAPAKELFGIK